MLEDSVHQARGGRAASWAVLATLGLILALLMIPSAAQATNVYAAASLNKAFPEIDNSDDVAYSFAGSGALRTQIKDGAPADVFAAASPNEPQELFEQGYCERPVTFATNEVAMLVPAGNPGGITSINDLATGSRTIAIGIEDVPIGNYTRQVLSGMGLLGILDTNTVTEEPNVSAITSKVALGEVDVGFAYVTDGMLVADQGVEIIKLPEGSQPKVRYQICVVKRGGADTAGAEAYIQKVLGPQGRTTLAKYGFGLPPDPADVAVKQGKLDQAEQAVKKAQQRVNKAQQQVKKTTKSKDQVCKKAKKAKQRRAGNARKLKTKCEKSKKNLTKSKKSLNQLKQDLRQTKKGRDKAKQELQTAKDALANA